MEVKANALAKSVLVPESKSGKQWRDQSALMAFLRRSQSISYVAFEVPFAAMEAVGGAGRHITLQMWRATIIAGKLHIRVREG